MATGLRRLTERKEDGQPILDEDNGEQLMHLQSETALVLGNQPPLSPGTLYISTKKVIWLSDVDKEIGYAVNFLSISLHAISRDPESYPSPCIYAQIETEAGEDDDSGDSDSEQTDIFKISEMRLIPSDPNELELIFDVFCECAELNPELEQDEEEEHNWIFSADQLVDDDMVIGGRDSAWQIYDNTGTPIGYSNGNHDLAQSVLELQIDDQRFDDAEELDREARSDRQ